MNIILWLLLGIVLVIPLLAYANHGSIRFKTALLGQGLVIAACVYVVFAVFSGSPKWLLIEAIGVPIYGAFYVLAKRISLHFLAIGWLLHPIWDVFLHLSGPAHHIAPAWYAVACISFDLVVAGYIFYHAVQQNFLNSDGGV